MKTVAYFKSTNNQITKHTLNHYLRIVKTTESHDGSIPEKLYQLSSDVYDEDEMVAKYSNFGIFLDEDEALTFGQLLQPARVLQDEEGNDYDYLFELEDTEDVQLAKYKMSNKNLLETFDSLYDTLITKGVIDVGDVPELDDLVTKKKAKKAKKAKKGS